MSIWMEIHGFLAVGFFDIVRRCSSLDFQNEVIVFVHAPECKSFYSFGNHFCQSKVFAVRNDGFISSLLII